MLDPSLYEWGLCFADPWHYRKHVITVDDNAREDVFPDWDYLREFIYALHYENRVIVFKTRQMMLTWALALYATWLMIFHRNQTILVISENEKKAREVIKRCHDIINRLPQWMKVDKPAGRPSVERIDWRNGSRILSLCAVPSAARIYTAQFLAMDEAAFIRDFADIFAAASNTLGVEGRLAVISTPNPEPTGEGFKDLLLNAEARGFVRMDIPFSRNPTKDAAWEKKKRAELSERQFAFEHGLCLSQAGDGIVLKKLDPDFHFTLRTRIEKSWALFRTIDFGEHMACIWWAMEPNGTMHAYRELYIKGRSTEVRTAAIKAASGNEVYQLTMGDDAAKQERLNFATHGVPTVPCGTKSTLDSIFAMERLLEGDGIVRPGLFVNVRACPTLAGEFKTLVADAYGIPLRQQFDHGFDASRYLIYWLHCGGRSALSGHIQQDGGDGEAFDVGGYGAIAPAEELRQLENMVEGMCDEFDAMADHKWGMGREFGL